MTLILIDFDLQYLQKKKQAKNKKTSKKAIIFAFVLGYLSFKIGLTRFAFETNFMHAWHSSTNLKTI